jgi:hypothetical protein
MSSAWKYYLASTWNILTNNLEKLTEELELVIPHRAVSYTSMDEQDRMPGARDLIKQISFIDWGKTEIILIRIRTHRTSKKQIETNTGLQMSDKSGLR